jgi:hypothetical protein
MRERRGRRRIRVVVRTYTAWMDVIEPLRVEVIRSCSSPMSVPSVGW